MLFSSAIFLFFFLPLLLSVYFLAPKKTKNLVLLIASLAFYTFGEKELVLLILASVLIDYSAGRIIEGGWRKAGLYFSIISNLGILFYFKYSSFVYENYYSFLEFFELNTDGINTLPEVILPLGISFFTFQTMSYTIDVYRGNVKASKNIIDFATYVTMFPQLVAGPIVRYKDIYKQLQKRTITRSMFAEGLERFIIGLAKKMIIANNVAYIADGAFGVPTDQLSTSFAWVGIIAYSFQIYFDFSGYSDMAIGLGKMLGFDFLENFNYPYTSKSIREFWRRWHISLSTWFRDYVYIPLGGNRKSVLRTYMNLFLVFFVTGLWHGASWNFIVWGLLHGLFIVFEKIGFEKVLNKLKFGLSNIYTVLIIIITWVFFRAESLERAIGYLEAMFIFSNDNGLMLYFLRKESVLAILFAIIFSMNIYGFLRDKFSHRKAYYYSKFIVLITLFLISIMYLAVDSYNPFIYFKF
tara:strand:- start:963 stop:2363 length:1401 start_codon:yes stop_codon:yes gene_type:complete